MNKNNGLAEGPDGLVYTARLPLSSATLNFLAGLICGHLKKIGSRWRTLPAGKIAGIVLAVPRCDQRPGDLVGGNGVHRTTVSRWVHEVVGLLAGRAPRLDRALKKIARKGVGVVLLDARLAFEVSPTPSGRGFAGRPLPLSVICNTRWPPSSSTSSARCAVEASACRVTFVKASAAMRYAAVSVAAGSSASMGRWSRPR